MHTYAQDGAQFYLQGTKLMASDWAYAGSLTYKAALKGQTLQVHSVFLYIYMHIAYDWAYAASLTYKAGP